MTALLAAVEAGGDELAEILTGSSRGRVTIAGPVGAGKTTALRHAYASLRLVGPSVFLQASSDDVAPLNLMTGLAAGLTAAGHPLQATDDADRPPWDELLKGCSTALGAAGHDRVVVLVSDIDRLERRAGEGGAPGRHASDVLELLKRHAPRLATTSTRLATGGSRVVRLETPDLQDWLTDGAVWGELAAAAVDVAGRGPDWRRLPALTLRVAVALAHLKVLPPTPPATPAEAGRVLAQALAGRRLGRPAWAAWQLVAAIAAPLSSSALGVLLKDLPEGVSDDPLLCRCLLFWHDSWHLHPILRTVARFPPALALERALPDDMRRTAGRRMVTYFRGEAARLAALGETAEAATAAGAALDACALAQDDILVDGLVQDLPDPYDHVGRRNARHPTRSRAAFARALDIDDNDATAVRGLANAEDRQAVDSRRVEQLFRLAIKLEPQDVDSHVRLVGVLLAAARPGMALEAFDAAAAIVSGTLSEDQLAERLLIPVARVAVAAGHLPLAARAAAAARGLVALEQARDVDRLVEALVEVLEYGEFVSPARLGTRWWESPALLSDYDSGRHPLSRWLAARVDGLDGESVTLHCADVGVQGRRDARPDRFWTDIALENLRDLSLDELSDPLLGAILEIGIYGDGADAGTTVVRVEPVTSVVLPEGTLPLDRYARNLK